MCVTYEVSMCRGERGEFRDVCIDGWHVHFVCRVWFSPLSSLCFAGFCLKALCLDRFFVRDSPNQRVYFGVSISLVPIRAGVEGEVTVRVFWS